MSAADPPPPGRRPPLGYRVFAAFPILMIPIAAFILILISFVMPYLTGASR